MRRLDLLAIKVDPVHHPSAMIYLVMDLDAIPLH